VYLVATGLTDHAIPVINNVKDFAARGHVGKRKAPRGFGGLSVESILTLGQVRT
jgi:hypothetical protein